MTNFNITEEETVSRNYYATMPSGESVILAVEMTKDKLVAEVFDFDGSLVETFSPSSKEFVKMIVGPNNESKTNGTNVWVLTINSRYGPTTSTHATKAGAEKYLLEWVEMMWDLSSGIPFDENKAVEEYFNFFLGESYAIVGTKMGE